MKFALVAIAFALLITSAPILAGDNPASLGLMADKLQGPPRQVAQTWLDRIQKELAAGTDMAGRLMTELGTALRVLTMGQAPGTSKAWAGLVATPDDLVTVDEMNNVELVEKGVLFGGSQPVGAAWALLKKKGIKTVVNLRAEDNSEAATVTGLGLKAVYIPIVLKAAPTEAQARQFASLVNDPANRPVYVHDQRGVDRTHTMIACWRLSKVTPINDVLTEAGVWGLANEVQYAFIKKLAQDWGTHPPR